MLRGRRARRAAGVLRGADDLAAAVGVARAVGGAVRAAHAGADVNVRAHIPQDDDFDETAARVLGLALKWFIVVLVAVMVALVGLVWLCTCAAKLCKTKQKPAKPAARAPPRPPPRAQALQSPLPRNWSRQVDGMSGKTYYVNHATGATSWERPI